MSESNRFFKMNKRLIRLKKIASLGSDFKALKNKQVELSERYIDSSLTDDDAKKLLYIKNIEGKARCAYCDVAIPKSKAQYAIDRIDNNKGYDLGNIVFACPNCNASKAKGKLYNLLEFAQDVVSNLNYSTPADGVAKIMDKAKDLKELVSKKNIEGSRRRPDNFTDVFKIKILNVLANVYKEYKQKYQDILHPVIQTIEHEIEAGTGVSWLQLEEVRGEPDFQKAFVISRRLKGDLFSALREQFPNSGNNLTYENLKSKGVFDISNLPTRLEYQDLTKEAIQILELENPEEKSSREERERYRSKVGEIKRLYDDYKLLPEAQKDKRVFIKSIIDLTGIPYSLLAKKINMDNSMPDDLQALFASKKEARYNKILSIFKSASLPPEIHYHHPDDPSLVVDTHPEISDILEERDRIRKLLDLEENPDATPPRPFDKDDEPDPDIPF